MHAIIRSLTVFTLAGFLVTGSVSACHRSDPVPGSAAAAPATSPIPGTAAPAPAAAPTMPAVPAMPSADPVAAAALPALPGAPAPVAGADSPARFNCNRAGSSQCTEYTQASFDSRAPLEGIEQMLREGCGNSSGVFAPGACATANLLGTCMTSENDRVRFYRTGPGHVTAARAAQNCTDAVGGLAGTWNAATP